MKSFDSIQDMILEHIRDIDLEIQIVVNRETVAQLLQAKSQALLALAEVKGASR
ncbi:MULTISPECIES: hypothetical protein [Bacillus cereus group]|uniref:hypothetical protein n=1 Tax=Bacillus cereus group TaxID=86661 RepID=UPI001298A334|nr:MULTISPECIES: hypothetical protein [Bacillus cereus group]MEC0031088.1 hypothetical protein [Bacillus cereus]MRA82289.1 hypothetical protein [Bacillus thuringiensis]